MPKVKIPSIVYTVIGFGVAVLEILASQREQHDDIVAEVAKQMSSLNQK